MSRSAFLRMMAASASLLFGVVPAPALAKEPVRLVVFGDSLSDAGNHFAIFRTVARAPFAPEPAASYRIDGEYRLTNGATWIDHLTDLLGARPSGPAFANPRRFSNYAVHLARARPERAEAPFSLGDQVALFLEDRDGAAPARAWYVIWIGTNDLRDALAVLASGGDPGPIIAEAIEAVGSAIGALYESGARKFLIPNQADLALIPLLREAGPTAQAAGSQLSTAWNQTLAQALDGIRSELAGAQLRELDVQSVVAAVAASPKRFGFRELAEPCLRFGVVRRPVCSEPRRHLFWDGLHPTTAGHRIIALAALRELLLP